MRNELGAPVDYLNRALPSDCEVSFFVPCLNEAGNIHTTLTNILVASQRCKITYEILIFDDASTDSTREEIAKFSKENPSVRIHLINNPHRRGLARNYVDGAYLARGVYYMLVNGDAAEPAESLITILEPRGHADIIIPIFQQGDRRTWMRRKISRTFNFLVNSMSGLNVGYYNGPALHRRYNVMRWHGDTDGFGYQAEIITRLLQEGATYKEVTIANNDRVMGSSSALRLKNFLAVAHTLTQIGLRRLRTALFYKNRPDINHATCTTLGAGPTERQHRGI